MRAFIFVALAIGYLCFAWTIIEGARQIREWATRVDNNAALCAQRK
jgi:hypothetical protein